MGNEKETAIGHIIGAVVYSWEGFKAAWNQEMAFRIEMVVIAVLLPIGMWIGDSAVERALLIGSSMLVLITEFLNSAIENVVNRISTEHHILSKQAKDMGSAAAALSQLTAAVIWGMIVYDRFFG